jgi:hypothetical protein
MRRLRNALNPSVKIDQLIKILLDSRLLFVSLDESKRDEKGGILKTKKVMVNFFRRGLLKYVNVNKKTFEIFWFDDFFTPRGIARRIFDLLKFIDEKTKIETSINIDVPRVTVKGWKKKSILIKIKKWKDLSVTQGENYRVIVWMSPYNEEHDVQGKQFLNPNSLLYWVFTHQTFLGDLKGGCLFPNVSGLNIIKSKGMDLDSLKKMGFFMSTHIRKYKKNNMYLGSYDRQDLKKNDCLFYAIRCFYVNNIVVDSNNEKLSPTTFKKALGYYKRGKKEMKKLMNNKNIKNKKRGRNDLIPVSEMMNIEKLLGRKICVFVDNSCVYGLKEAEIKLCLCHYHYFAIFPQKSFFIVKIEDYDNVIDVCFDFESVVNNMNICQAYSYSLCFMDLESLVKFTYIYDGTELTPTQHLKKELLSIFNKYKKKIRLISFNGDKFDNILFAETLLKDKYKLEIFYNGNDVCNIKNFFIFGTYDLRKLLNGSLKYNCEAFKIADDKKKGEFNHFEAQELFDSCKNPADGFKLIKEKLGKKLTKYNELDVICLHELFKKCKIECMKLQKTLGLKPNKNLIYERRTVGSLSRRLSQLFAWKNGEKYFDKRKEDFEKYNNHKKKYEVPGIVPDYDMYQKYRNAIIGGRTQIFGEPCKVKNFVSADVTSLYPQAMSKNSLTFEKDKKMDHLYPSGKVKKVENLILEDNTHIHPALKYKLGIYEVHDIDQSNIKHNIIPGLKKDGTLNWSQKFIKMRELSTIMIALLEENGCKFSKVTNGIVWENNNTNYFSSYVDILYKLKAEQDDHKKNKDLKYNPALRQFIKILLNSLYGKFIENIHRESKEICSMGYGFLKPGYEFKEGLSYNRKLVVTSVIKEDFLREKWFTRFKHKHTLAGIFILDYSKYYMYHFIKRYENSIKYTDTDSIHIPLHHWEDLKQNYPHLIPNKSKKLGQFENEFDDYANTNKKNECIYLAKKIYCICDKFGNPSKYKCKGVKLFNNQGEDNGFILDKKTYYFEPKDKNPSKKILPKPNVKKYFESLLKNKKARIITKQWTRKSVISFLNGENGKVSNHGGIMINKIEKDIDIKKKITGKNCC